MTRFKLFIFVSLAVSLVGCEGIKFDSMFFNATATDGVYDFGDYPAEEVFIDVDGDQIQGFFITPATDVTSDVTVLYSHGNAENLGYFIDRALYFAEIGWNVFTYDYRGYGASEGVATGEHLRQDGVAAYNYLLSRSDVTQENLIIYGYSLGSHATLAIPNLVTEANWPVAVIVESAFAQGGFFVEDTTRLPLPTEWFLSEQMNNLELGSQITLPILLLHGNHDDFTNIRHSRALFEVIPSDQKEFYEVQWADHGDVPDWVLPSYNEYIQDYVESVIE